MPRMRHYMQFTGSRIVPRAAAGDNRQGAGGFSPRNRHLPRHAGSSPASDARLQGRTGRGQRLDGHGSGYGRVGPTGTGGQIALDVKGVRNRCSAYSAVPAGADCRFQPQGADRVIAPRFGSVRTAAIDAAPESRQFSIRLGSIHMFQPICGARHRRRGQ